MRGLAYPIATVAVLAMLAGPAAGLAQEAQRLPPYEKELLRLAEILGAVHYLRGLCGADEGQTWRSMMQELLEAENPTPERRAGLVESFNHGYRGFEQTYLTCNATAVWIIETYMEEGAEIAQRVASRYGQ
jgi:uncharacterized protein (TIGR02301 family)